MENMQFCISVLIRQVEEKFLQYSWCLCTFLALQNIYALQYLKLSCTFQDMAAHSSCDFGGGRTEKLALAKYRQVIWQGRVLNSQLTDEELRNTGRCPLTPEEIGLLLVALGFDSSTRLYLASHKV